jgi:Ceramidase
MDWTRAVNGYCERTDASYWSEPLNAVTNAAFLVAAALCWRTTARDPGARLLVVILAAIGVGSYLFHTNAQRWAMLADVLPIQAFILVYIYLATVRFLAAPAWAGFAAAIAFVPLSGLVGEGIRALFGPLNGSVGYMPVVLLIVAYALALARRAPVTAGGMAIGAVILTLSLFFRTIDEAVCGRFPLGTHFLWHLLNGVMLGWMILVMVRHEREGFARAER